MPFVAVHGRRMRYREAGAGRSGAPVVLVHGAGSSSAIWLDTFRRVARTRHVLAPDLPGHGRSEGGTSTYDELRDALGLFCAAMCLPPSVLVGHSLGGLLALGAALSWPDKVVGLGLVCTAALLKVAPPLFERIDGDWPRWADFLAEVAYSPETPADVRRAGSRIASTASQEITRADFVACGGLDARERLGEVRVPTLVVTGAHDLMTPARWGEALAAGIPDARLVTLRDCGHYPMHERPDELAGAVDDLLARVDGR